MNLLYLITARGGSKGLPGKNIKRLMGKPLLEYSIDVARDLADDSDICLSSDSQDIIEVAEKYGLHVPFVRPAELAADTSGSQDVIRHALEYYLQRGKRYQGVVLLQPTSPFRTSQQVGEMIGIFERETPDMVVSVRECHENPYFSLFEENGGFLFLSKRSSFVRRQDCPKVYAYNGSVYVISVPSVTQKKFSDFERNVKYLMDDIHSIDIDNHFDWLVAEMVVEKGLWSRNR
ncbi:MAG: cytidylyltransferase domain-containing protein [Bacteroidota bacterium]